MKHGYALLLGLAICFDAGSRQPTGMYQHATIRVVDSHPCFSVADTEEARRTPPTIAAISVNKYVDSEWKRQWSWGTPIAPETTLHPDDCIPYGFHPAGDPQDQPSEPLHPGARYHVAINSGIPNPSPRGDRKLGRMYSLDFCLTRTTSGEVEAVIVPSSRGVSQWQLCEAQDR